MEARETQQKVDWEKEVERASDQGTIEDGDGGCGRGRCTRWKDIRGGREGGAEEVVRVAETEAIGGGTRGRGGREAEKG